LENWREKRTFAPQNNTKPIYKQTLNGNKN
jgi:hypothetical protein